MNEVNAFLDSITKWAIPLVLAGVLGWATKELVGPIRAWFQANLDVEKQRLIQTIFEQVVRTAEATRLKATIEDKAFDVLTWAIAEAEKHLTAYGIVIDEEGIVKLLRAELHRLLDRPETQELIAVPQSRELTSGGSVPAFGINQKIALQHRLWA